jgi:hypothetical protein
MGAVSASASSHRAPRRVSRHRLLCRSNPVTRGPYPRFGPTLQSLHQVGRAPVNGGGHGGRAIHPQLPEHDEAATGWAVGCATGGGTPRRACRQGPSMPRGRWEVGPTRPDPTRPKQAKQHQSRDQRERGGGHHALCLVDAGREWTTGHSSPPRLSLFQRLCLTLRDYFISLNQILVTKILKRMIKITKISTKF